MSPSTPPNKRERGEGGGGGGGPLANGLKTSPVGGGRGGLMLMMLGSGYGLESPAEQRLFSIRLGFKA